MKSFRDFFNEAKLYYPKVNATRGSNQGMTSWDPSKTFPTQDNTILIPFPSKAKKKKIKRLRKD
jgi:hypothetical protein